MFTEHTTESGTVAYYAPGEEMDCLTKALMICLFAGRISLQQGNSDPVIRRGPATPLTADESFNLVFADVLGDASDGGLSPQSTNRTNKSRLFKRTQRQW